MEQNWGAPQQQGAQWPAAAGFQPALGPYAAYGAYPPMAPRAYPMLMAAPAQQGMLAAAPAQQLAPPPAPLPRAAADAPPPAGTRPTRREFLAPRGLVRKW